MFKCLIKKMETDTDNCKRNQKVNRPPVEDLIVNSKEHKLLKKFKRSLESRYNVNICMPKSTSLDSDIIFVSILGEESNRNRIKKFLAEKMIEPKKNEDKDVVLITLSDSEKESSMESEGDSEDIIFIDLCFEDKSGKTAENSLDESVCIIEAPLCLENSLQLPVDCQQTKKVKRSKRKRNNTEVKLNTGLPSSGTDSAEFCEVVSSSDVMVCSFCQTDISAGVDSFLAAVGDKGQFKGFCSQNCMERYEVMNKISKNTPQTQQACSHCKKQDTFKIQVEKKSKLCESIISEEPVTIKSADDFIPLIDESKCVKSSEIDNTVLVRDEPDEPEPDEPEPDEPEPDEPEPDEPEPDKPEPEPQIPRRLRPIVIDGSNVAMQHGKASHTYSVKGIQLAIDEFLKRGHTEVVAFVPGFRRSPSTKRTVVTTNAPIFDDLERKQHVVFTPSRRLDDGKCISSYDDRFVVEYAASNGGVIVSNDNFRDLLNESESFKKAIKERLLMFCFVGNKFMIPNDPLGRDGPRLEDFLCFPPDSKETEEKSQ